jgi:hypothetical protein
MLPWHKVTINPISLSATMCHRKYCTSTDFCVIFSSEIVTLARNKPLSNFEGMSENPLVINKISNSGVKNGR